MPNDQLYPDYVIYFSPSRGIDQISRQGYVEYKQLSGWTPYDAFQTGTSLTLQKGGKDAVIINLAKTRFAREEAEPGENTDL